LDIGLKLQHKLCIYTSSKHMFSVGVKLRIKSNSNDIQYFPKPIGQGSFLDDMPLGNSF
jgi:hypothetical protein